MSNSFSTDVEFIRLRGECWKAREKHLQWMRDDDDDVKEQEEEEKYEVEWSNIIRLWIMKQSQAPLSSRWIT